MQTLKTLTATKAKANFSAVLTKAGYKGERIVIKKGARPTAVVLDTRIFSTSSTLRIASSPHCSPRASGKIAF